MFVRNCVTRWQIDGKKPNDKLKTEPFTPLYQRRTSIYTDSFGLKYVVVVKENNFKLFNLKSYFLVGRDKYWNLLFL